MSDDQNGIGVDVDLAVGKVVYKRRKQLGLKLREVADMSDISAAMVSRIENGLISPSLGTLHALSKALALPLVSFFEHTAPTLDINLVKAGTGIASKRIAEGHVHDFQIYCKYKDDLQDLEVADVTVSRETNGTHPSYVLGGFVVLRILTGECVYSVGQQIFELSEGDVLSFNAELRHGMQEVVSPEVTFMSIRSKVA
ncbi:helix-turn-helix domain-containing protein [Cochlodiniinecator piscidefendens]|uniref:helix-turn-helix domain-containing protein n=1 Tax=Cochlodiniinecator piscidefendens TaxID=2715756 RepID=UPI001407D3F0|nr:helix-turn-helix domain-containing protein [Cochlodiniinecator piscidefendens]